MAEIDVNGDKIPVPDYAMYTCEKAPSFRMRLIDGAPGTPEPDDIYAQFENSVWKTNEPKLIAKMDWFIANRPNISQLVRKTDWSAAARTAARARSEIAARTQTAKGAVSSQTFSKAATPGMQEDTRAKLRAEGVDEDKIEAVVNGMREAGIPIVESTGSTEHKPQQNMPGKMVFGSAAKAK